MTYLFTSSDLCKAGKPSSGDYIEAEFNQLNMCYTNSALGGKDVMVHHCQGHNIRIRVFLTSDGTCNGPYTLEIRKDTDLCDNVSTLRGTFYGYQRYVCV